ncbi:MAG: hypothetical protein CMP59_02800 [Flavobacteriales bacterium]|nr:hypothetical protein [Flavobacteriales bacterium]
MRTLSIKTKLLNSFRAIFKLGPLESMIRSAVSGKSPNSLFGKMVPNNYQYSEGSVREFDYFGIKLFVDISDYIGHYLYFGFKDIGQDKLLSLAKEGMHVLDVGTNIGSTLLRFADKVGPSGKVIGFEPDSFNFKACEKNISLNSFNNLEVYKFGLGAEEAQLKLKVDTESNRGGNRISTDIEAKGEMVPIRKLDNLVEEFRWTKLDLIKIDVEGFELKVIQGAKQTLKNFHPTLFIELDDQNLSEVGDTAKGLISYLNELGYDKIRNAETNERVSAEDDFTGLHFDIIVE